MNIAREHRLAYNQLPDFCVGQLFDRVPTDQCPAEVQTWIMAYLMAKRCNMKVPPFPTRYMARYFGALDINIANGWHALGDLSDCAPASDNIVFGSMLDLPEIGKQNSDE